MSDRKTEHGLTFPPAMRIRCERQFERIFANGRRGGAARFTVLVLENEYPHPRLGVSVPKRFGNAVARNRVKRLIREAFRLTQNQMPHVDIVCVPRPGFEPTLEKLKTIILREVSRLTKR